MSDDWIKPITASGDQTFYYFGGPISIKPLIPDEITFHIRGETYTLPAVEHEQHDVVSSLCAVVVALHQRIEKLEAALKGQDDDPRSSP